MKEPKFAILEGLDSPFTIALKKIANQKDSFILIEKELYQNEKLTNLIKEELKYDWANSIKTMALTSEGLHITGEIIIRNCFMENFEDTISWERLIELTEYLF